MIEQLVANHLAIYTDSLVAEHLILGGVASFVCDKCGLTCSISNQMTFTDWDLTDFTVCPPCFDLETYHKIQMRKAKPYYYLKKEIARHLGIPFDE